MVITYPGHLWYIICDGPHGRDSTRMLKPPPHPWCNSQPGSVFFLLLVAVVENNFEQGKILKREITTTTSYTLNTSYSGCSEWGRLWNWWIVWLQSRHDVGWYCHFNGHTGEDSKNVSFHIWMLWNCLKQQLSAKPIFYMENWFCNWRNIFDVVRVYCTSNLCGTRYIPLSIPVNVSW